MTTYLTPDAGTYKTPIMQSLRLTSTDDPKFLQFVFESERQNGDRTEKLTILVPVHVSVAALVGRGIKTLQAKGIVPILPESNSPSQPS